MLTLWIQGFFARFLPSSLPLTSPFILPPPLMPTFTKLTKRKYYNSTVGKSFSAATKTSENFPNRSLYPEN
jgi:hypothetical protein